MKYVNALLISAAVGIIGVILVAPALFLGLSDERSILGFALGLGLLLQLVAIGVIVVVIVLLLADGVTKSKNDPESFGDDWQQRYAELQQQIGDIKPKVLQRHPMETGWFRDDPDGDHR